jgi:hypothetical protein
MATKYKGSVIGLSVDEIADAAVLGNTFVKVTAGGQGVTTCGAGQLALGVAKFDAGADPAGLTQTLWTTVHLDGLHPVVASAAIAAGARVMSDANGNAVTYAAGAGVFSRGIARTAAVNPGDIIEVFLQSPAQG